MAAREERYKLSVGMETAYNDGGASFTDLPIFIDGLPDAEPELEENEIYRTTLARNAAFVNRIKASIKLRGYLKGSGTAGTAPELGKLLRACCLSQTISGGVSVTYAPVESSFESIAIKANLDGVEHKLTGCRGDLTLNFEVGKIITFESTQMGIYNAPTLVSVGTPSYADNSIKPPAVYNIGLTINGNAASLTKLQIHFNPNIEAIGDMNADNPMGEYAPGQRVIEGTFRVLRDSYSDLEFPAAAVASTELALAMSNGVGATAGNIIKVAIGNMQFEKVTPVVENRRRYYDVKFRAVYNSTLASEFALIFT